MIQIHHILNTNKYIWSIALLLIFSSFSYSQNLTGPTTVAPNSTHTYTYDDGNIHLWNWTVIGGTVTSTNAGGGTAISATVQWGSSGSGSVAFSSFGNVLETLGVTITGGSSGGGGGSSNTNFSNENYVHSLTPRVETTDVTSLSNNEKIESITYFDGLGRAKQSIGIRAGGNKLKNNILDWETFWTLGSGSASQFGQNGSTSENKRINDIDPHGNTSIIWECGNDSSSGPDGGWNTSYYYIDNTESYQYTV